MGTLWDDIKDKLSSAKESAEKVAKIAMDKTTNVVDITKLNLAKSETDGKVRKLCAKIGEIIYEQYKNGAEFDGDIEDALIEIDRFKAESEELDAQIAALKSIVSCPGCGQKNDKSSEYCSQCGAKLVKEDADEEACEEADCETEEAETVDVVAEEAESSEDAAEE